MSRTILIGYVLFAMAAILQLLGTILPYWKTNDPSVGCFGGKCDSVNASFIMDKDLKD